MTALLKNLAGDLHQLTSSANGEKGVLGEGGTRVGGVGGRLQLGPSPSTPHPLSTPPHPPSTPPPPPLNSPPAPASAVGPIRSALSSPSRPQRWPGRPLALRAGAVPSRGRGGRGRALPHLRWAELLLPRPRRSPLQPGAGVQRTKSGSGVSCQSGGPRRGAMGEKGL